MKNELSKFIALIYLYLAGHVSGRQFVREVDNLVASDQLIELPKECKTEFDLLHTKIALCVWDEQTFLESPHSYIKEPEMEKSVKEFISKWGKLFAQHL